MCTKPNTTATNPDNFNEEKAVFEEIFTWARHINNSIWLITSFFVSLNLVVIKTVLSNSENSQVKDFLGDLTCRQQILLAITIFVTLWLIPAITALTMMVKSDNLFSFVIKPGPFTSERLSMALTLEGSESSQNPGSSLSTFRKLILKMHKKLEIYRKVLSTIRTPFGFIIASFTVLFGLAWLWIFPYIIEKAT